MIKGEIKMDDMNQVILCGTIISVNINRKVGAIRLAIHSDNSHVNFPQIIFYDSRKLDGYSIKQKVKIIAHTQTRTEKVVNGNSKGQTIIVGDSIESSKRRLLQYFSEEDIPDEDGGNALDINDIVLVGQVRSINPIQPDLTIVKMAINTGGRQRQANVSCFHRQSEIALMLEPNKRIAVTAYACTSSKEMEKLTVYYQNIVCTDICAIE